MSDVSKRHSGETGARPAGLDIAIPGSRSLRLAHLVLDLNGTLAKQGSLLPGVADRIHQVSAMLECHVLTADTHGGAAAAATELGCRLEVIATEAQDVAKSQYVVRLGAERCAAIGNGANDAGMLADAALGICVIGPEGAATAALLSSDVVCTTAADALDLLLWPLRLHATLRR